VGIEEYFSYDVSRYQFVELVTNLFGCKNLQNLHESVDERYDLFTQPGRDSDTIFHKRFYDKMRSGWPEFLELYKTFIRDNIVPILGSNELIYQKWPTFRVHLPNNVAVGGWHRDSDYNHPPNEINFIVALTPMFESNTTIAESEPGKMDFHQLELDPGMFVKFDGNKCMHGNLPNRTGVSRISFDFRVLRVEDYDESFNLMSLSHSNKFVVGEYYEKMTNDRNINE
jgi:hypothetical protein